MISKRKTDMDRVHLGANKEFPIKSHFKPTRYGGNALTQITISIGLAMYPMHGNNMQDLITAADNALYEAKNSGRNKTVLYHIN